MVGCYKNGVIIDLKILCAEFEVCLSTPFLGEEVTGARQSSRGRKTQDIQGKRLFEGHDVSEDDHEEGREDEDDDTPLYTIRRAMKANRASGVVTRAHNMGSTSKAAERENNGGAFSDTPIYNNSLYGSATEEQLPI